jgi:hypothetical protein
MSKPAPVSVVETPEFLAATKRIMDEQERSQLIDSDPHLKAHTTCPNVPLE